MVNSNADRDHDSPEDSVIGEGGAGFYSDGKYSFFPAGASIWNLPNRGMLEASYSHLGSILKKFYQIPEFPGTWTADDSSENWTLKEYESIYLSIDNRKELVCDMTRGYRDNILTRTEVTSIEKKEDMYVIHCKNLFSGENTKINSRKIVMGGGRFMPLFLSKIGFIPMSFKRLEFGVRIEGPSSSKLYNISKQTDPKFIKFSETDNSEYRTFCWCKNGQVVCTNSGGIRTYSGRSDCAPTLRSNFGMNVRVRDSDKLYLLKMALDTKEFKINLENDMDIPDSYKEIYRYLSLPIKSFLDLAEIDKADYHQYTLIGPTIEGVGEYPVTDDNLKVKDENIWIGGDASGKFRGIVASMISGIYIAMQFVEEKDSRVSRYDSQ
jgi:uncharacterized FAD-dependent dehydrogenase